MHQVGICRKALLGERGQTTSWDWDGTVQTEESGEGCRVLYQDTARRSALIAPPPCTSTPRPQQPPGSRSA